MKIRQEVSLAKMELMREIRDQVTDGHDCSANHIEGMSCIFCALDSLQRPFALLQYVRSKGWGRKLFMSENKLIDLLGESELKKRIQIEVDLIRNVPKKNCKHCGKIVGLWMPYSLAAVYVNYGNGSRLRSTCVNCGTEAIFTKEELPINLRKRRNLSTQKIVAASLARKMGYQMDEKEKPINKYIELLNEPFFDESHNEEEEEE